LLKDIWILVKSQPEQVAMEMVSNLIRWCLGYYGEVYFTNADREDLTYATYLEACELVRLNRRYTELLCYNVKLDWKFIRFDLARIFG